MSQIIEITYEKVKSYLQTLYGDNYNHLVSELDHKFIIARGSAMVNVSIKPWHEDDSIVQALSYVVHGAKLSNELYEFLLKQNSRTPFGAFGLSFDGTITFSHSIAGANLDLNELGTTVNHVAFMADEYDDIIRNIGGGYRAVDGQASMLDDVVVQPRKILIKKKSAPKKKVVTKKPIVKKKKNPVKKVAIKKVTSAKVQSNKKSPAKKTRKRR